jgi:acyl-coenzyme A thioesterase PaaI-like protein
MPGLIHGGILFGLMDEALGWALYHQGLRGLSARARAEVRRNDGSHRLLAESNATMFLLGPPPQD